MAHFNISIRQEPISQMELKAKSSEQFKYALESNKTLSKNDKSTWKKGYYQKRVDWSKMHLFVNSDYRMYSAGNFRENEAKDQNWIEQDLIILDVDDGLTINEAKILFSGYECLIVTSRNHQKQKGDKTPCDRFRVILPTEETIKCSIDEYKKTMRLIMDEEYQFADKSCKDPSRIYFGYSDAETHYLKGGKYFDFAYWLEKTKKIEQIEALAKERSKKEFQKKEVNTSDIENALKRIDPDIEFTSWLEIGMAIHSELGEQGFDIWRRWSECGSKYSGENDLLAHWKTFGKGSGVTIGTLFYYAK